MGVDFLIREAKYAGSWYEGTEAGLKKTLESFFKTDKRGPKIIPEIREDGPRQIVAIVSPHAGYMYSAAIAAYGYAELAFDGRPDLFIICGVDHHGYGMRAAASTQSEGSWRSPLGTAKINSEVANKILSIAPKKIQDAPSAHQAEHSLEIQLPFLQYIYGPEIEFVPIMISSSTLADFQAIGNAIAEACKEMNVVLVASTDFTHFESATCAKNKDQKAIDAILNLDEELLYKTVRQNNISMCGYGSTSTVIRAAVALGAKEAVLLRYGNSSEVTGDSSDVVAYASLKLLK